MILTLASNSASAPLTLDLTPYVDVADGDGLDFANPAYSTKIWSHSLLREGATESLEQTVEREIVIPLKIGPIGGVPNAPTTLSATMAFIAQINQALRAGGATLTWQPDGTSQATVFDAISGQVDVVYKFRAEQQKWTSCTLRFFAQPFGRTAGPRPYAAASGVGPLLMISPYASSGALAIGASTQAGVAGFGGAPMGASSGVFYAGSPSLAGDAPALLQISYTGPLPNTATNAGCVPYVAVSVLPDQNYHPYIPMADVLPQSLGTYNVIRASTIIGSQYVSVGGTHGLLNLAFPPLGNTIPPKTWEGQHRLLAIARASNVPFPGSADLSLISNSIVPFTVGQSVQGFDWQLYDIGTFSVTASQAIQSITIDAISTASTAAIDIAGFAVFPEKSTWYVNPTTLNPSQYGVPSAVDAANPLNFSVAPYTNTLFLDDWLGGQFLYAGASLLGAPSPAGMGASSSAITPYSRGLAPRPDPKNGLPIIAILGVGQTTQPSRGGPFFDIYVAPGASWPNPQNLRTTAQVNVIERSRYVLP